MILKPSVTKDTQQIISVVQFNLGVEKYRCMISKKKYKSCLSPLGVITLE